MKRLYICAGLVKVYGPEARTQRREPGGKEMTSYTIEVSEPIYHSLNQQARERNSSLDSILERLLAVAPFILPETDQITNEEDLQLELIKLYATDLEYQELVDVKQMLATFFARKATNKADQIWDEQHLSDQTMEEWLNEG